MHYLGSFLGYRNLSVAHNSLVPIGKMHLKWNSVLNFLFFHFILKLFKGLWMDRRGDLLLGVVGFNLVLLTVDRYAFVIHLPLSKWRPYFKNNKYFFRKLKGMENIHKGMENMKSTWKSQGNFLSEKSGNPVPNTANINHKCIHNKDWTKCRWKYQSPGPYPSEHW